MRDKAAYRHHSHGPLLQIGQGERLRSVSSRCVCSPAPRTLPQLAAADCATGDSSNTTQSQALLRPRDTVFPIQLPSLRNAIKHAEASSLIRRAVHGRLRGVGTSSAEPMHRCKRGVRRAIDAVARGTRQEAKQHCTHSRRAANVTGDRSLTDDRSFRERQARDVSCVPASKHPTPALHLTVTPVAAVEQVSHCQ